MTGSYTNPKGSVLITGREVKVRCFGNLFDDSKNGPGNKKDIGAKETYEEKQSRNVL